MKHLLRLMSLVGVMFGVLALETRLGGGNCQAGVTDLLQLIRDLRQTRDLLLPRLISGEVDVSKLHIRIPENAA